MTDTTSNIWNDSDGEEEVPKKKHHRLRWFLLLLIVVLAVVGVAAYRDGTGFDAIRRYFAYGSDSQTAEETETGYRYDASSSNRFAAVNDALVVLSQNTLKVLSSKGDELWSENVKMTQPALAVGGGCAVAYDVGGTDLYVVDSGGKRMELHADPTEPLLAATLNKNGWLAVTAEKNGYKGSVSVYNAKGTLMFDFYSSQRFVTNGYVTDDNALLAAVTLGQEDSVFVSNIVLYDLSKKQDPVADYDISDSLVFDLGEQDGRLITVSDRGIHSSAPKGGSEATYSYSGFYLREYDFHGDGFTALLLNRYQSGSLGKLVTVDESGQELAALDVNQEVVSLSAAGRYLAVLYVDRLVLYNQNLQVYAALEDLSAVKDVLMRKDGSALLIGSESATLFLP